MSETEELQSRSGMVAVVGRTNVGKSTLVNHVVGEKVSIVSPVVQTTRNLVRGILTEPRGQIALVDTPGVHKSQNELGRRMNKMARSVVEGSDLVMLVLDAAVEPRLEDDGWLRRLLFAAPPLLFVLNKSDCDPLYHVAYRALWEEIQKEKEQQRAVEWMQVSALSGAGMPELVQRLFDRMLPGPPLFPEEMLSDYPRKLMIGDFVREKFFMVLHQELPHAIAVWVDQITEKDDEMSVSCTIYVDRPSQKAIVIGRNGRLIKKVRVETEHELTDVFEKRVKLDLWVKVEKNWGKNFWILQRLGYA